MNPRPLGPKGAHEMLDLSGVVFPTSVAESGKWMLDLLRKSVSHSGAREVHFHVESFDGSISPEGFAAVVLLDESHVSAHCYSDLGILAIDAFTCGGTDPKKISDYILGELQNAIPTIVVEQNNRQTRFPAPGTKSILRADSPSILSSETEIRDGLADEDGSTDVSISGQEMRDFLIQHYRHFNAGTLADAVVSLNEFLKSGGQLIVTLAGAMSTAEIGRSLAPLIRAGKIAGICTTGANLEEDLFNLVAHDHYQRIPDWRSFTPEEDLQLEKKGLNRVTDTCIPEEQAVRYIEKHLLAEWRKASEENLSFFPHEYFYKIISLNKLTFQADPKNSWLLAASEVNLPIWTPGWEDSTCGNVFAAGCLRDGLKPTIVKSGIEAMLSLTEWYRVHTSEESAGAGLLQVGGGIAGDFPICVVPMLRQDLGEEVPLWSWFGQISESSTSYGGYSGAPPNEKISWGKLAVDTPRFMIESDATIVLPLLFTALLD